MITTDRVGDRHRQLIRAAQAVLESATAVGAPSRPMAGIPAAALRDLRAALAELEETRRRPKGEPSLYFTMSAS